KLLMAIVISVVGFRGALEFQNARPPQALPTNLARSLAPVDAETDTGRGNSKGRHTSSSFELAQLISLSCALSLSNKSFRAKSFVSPYPTTVRSSLTYFLSEE